MDEIGQKIDDNSESNFSCLNNPVVIAKNRELILSEFSNVENYLERLIFVLHDHADISHLPTIKSTLVEFANELKDLASIELSLNFEISNMEDRASVIITDLKTIFKLIQTLIKLTGREKKELFFYKNFINIMYTNAFYLHQKVSGHTTLEVQAPRCILARIEETIDGIQRYELQLSDVLEATSFEHAILKNIETKKEELYDRYLKKGHFFLLNKNTTSAHEFFMKAKNLKSTAEIFTLLGHLAAKEGNVEKAKEYCLKAIKVDPNFGAAYNDYGVYLLNENKPHDALKWFSIAKKCIYYQNRDFAFINSGRAYFAMQEFELAQSEFENALALTPDNAELKGLVIKIKENLETRELKSFIKNFQNSNYYGNPSANDIN